jgi:surface protein
LGRQQCIKSVTGQWDVSGVTNMEHLFMNAESFSQPLVKWDVSNVTSMKETQSLSATRVRNVTNRRVCSMVQTNNSNNHRKDGM